MGYLETADIGMPGSYQPSPTQQENRRRRPVSTWLFSAGQDAPRALRNYPTCRQFPVYSHSSSERRATGGGDVSGRLAVQYAHYFASRLLTRRSLTENAARPTGLHGICSRSLCDWLAAVPTTLKRLVNLFATGCALHCCQKRFSNKKIKRKEDYKQ